jgi:hypothetical protein
MEQVNDTAYTQLAETETEKTRKQYLKYVKSTYHIILLFFTVANIATLGAYWNHSDCDIVFKVLLIDICVTNLVIIAHNYYSFTTDRARNIIGYFKYSQVLVMCVIAIVSIFDYGCHTAPFILLVGLNFVVAVLYLLAYYSADSHYRNEIEIERRVNQRIANQQSTYQA